MSRDFQWGMAFGVWVGAGFVVLIYLYGPLPF